MPVRCETTTTTTTVVVPADPQLSDEENSFLLTAFKHWSKPDDFTDDQVSRAKTIFQRIFNDDISVLKGGEFADSLVLQPVNDPTLFYAMVIGADSRLTWKKAYVNATNCFQLLNSHLIPFDTFLSMVTGSSSCTTDNKTSLSSFLNDFFKFWKRKFSPERIARVTQKKTTDVQQRGSKRIPRNNDTLKRMRWELRMLGFEECGGAGETFIYFNWVDPVALDKGYAPQSFTVSLRGDVGDSSSSDDEEVEGLSDGVFIDETYGHSSTMHLLKWEHWDAFLLRQMKPVV